MGSSPCALGEHLSEPNCSEDEYDQSGYSDEDFSNAEVGRPALHPLPMEPILGAIGNAGTVLVLAVVIHRT
jgi:hypothetical protein